MDIYSCVYILLFGWQARLGDVCTPFCEDTTFHMTKHMCAKSSTFKTREFTFTFTGGDIESSLKWRCRYVSVVLTRVLRALVQWHVCVFDIAVYYTCVCTRCWIAWKMSIHVWSWAQMAYCITRCNQEPMQGLVAQVVSLYNGKIDCHVNLVQFIYSA